MIRHHNSRQVDVQPGEMALAPTVDHPRAFAVKNESEGVVILSFAFDAGRHMMTVTIRDASASRGRRHSGEHGHLPT